MPRGAEFGVLQIVEAAFAVVFVAVLFIALTRNALPWRTGSG